jgi:hypothetical protein
MLTRDALSIGETFPGANEAPGHTGSALADVNCVTSWII